MPEEPINPVGEKSTGPRSQLGLYRSHLTSASHRSFITVGRTELLNDTLEILRGNIGKKPKHHQLFIAPRGCGKTHFLSLIEDAIEADPALGAAYDIVRFPEEARRVLGFADFLLQICEILKDKSSPGSRWHTLHERLSTEENDEAVIDTLVPAIQNEREETGRVLILMVENLHQIMEEQIKQDKSIKALRGFLMQDNGCLLIATSPLHFGALSKADQPFYDFFDIQVLDPLSVEDTIALIRRNLEWDQRQDLLSRFPELLPKLRSLHTLTGGTPRLVVMLYELLSTESITEVKEQFLRLIDRITPFYQDRLNDLSPQERAVLETIATMRAEWPHEAPLKTPGNIASRMRMKPAQVSSLLARLTKGLYLVSAPNPDDGRSSLYHIREGFFDLWLAMNVSRAARQRIPLLTDFFAAVYEKDEERRQKREEYWRRLEAGEFDEDSAENLNYLSTVGTPEECAPEKLRLAATLAARGEKERPELLKRELMMFPMDSSSRWLCDRIDSTEPEYLDDFLDLIRQWEEGRKGGAEGLATRMREMGEGLTVGRWTALRIEFLEDQVEQLQLGEDRVATRLHLASHFRYLAKWQEAEAQSRAALDDAENLHIDGLISWTLNDLALILKDTNRLTEAEPLVRRAVSIAEASFGCDHPNVAACLNNLAQLLQDTNRLSEAEPLMRRALAITEASLGNDHPHVAIHLSNLASLLQYTNRVSEAEALMHRALAIDEAGFGSDHPKVAIRLTNLAQLLSDTNRISEAEPLMRRSLAIAEASFGDDHPNIAIRLNNLAQLLRVTNRLAEAEPLMRRALAIDEASFGSDHPSVAIRLNNLAQLLQSTNHLLEAEPLMKQSFKALLRSRVVNNFLHPQFGTLLANYQSLLSDLGHDAASTRTQLIAIAEECGVDQSELNLE